MSDQASPAGSPARTSSTNEKNSANACLACRKVKMKCHVGNNNTVCDRCIRKSFHCVFEKHRRGRKPTLRSNNASRRNATNRQSAAVEETAQRNSNTALRDSLPPKTASGSSPNPRDKPHSDFWVLLEGFRPSGLLNKQAMTGRLSLENITHGHNSSDAILRADDEHIPADDPVRRGVVNSTIAASLFASFMRDLNPYVCQLDPVLHSFHYVQRRSAFLLSAILAASAKAFNPSIQSSLQEHTEELFGQCFRKGKKSIEIIHAIMIMTYWKSPDDTRAWLSIGYVIRMGMELGLHKLTPRGTEDLERTGEVDRRYIRSMERTWLLLFVYDRSLALQTGGPSMIPRNDLIESAHKWYDNAESVPHDRLLCALVTLRLIGSEVFDLLNPHRSSYRSTLLGRSDGLTKILLDDIHKWHDRWSSAPETTRDDLYQFFISFYGTGVRLLFSLFPLQATLTSGLPDELIDKPSLLISYSSAVEMLQLLVQPRFSPLLYFVQDSVHIMIAYAAIFLIKFLLSIPQSMRTEIEDAAIEVIRKAADMFSALAAPPNSGCGLQAKFLHNVLRVFKKAQEPRPARPTHGAQPVLDDQAQAQDLNNGHVSSGTVNGLIGIGGETTAQFDNGNSSYPMQDSATHDGNLGGYENAFGLQDFTFADDDIWASLFADAGFSINDGVFLPYGESELGNMGPPT